MKRPRFYNDDLSDDDKPASRDWSRRDTDHDRPPSSHRRYYSSKPDSGRKLSSSSSYDRDDDREPLLPRPFRKRQLDHDLELDRRKFSFDRHREGGGGERDRSLSSPRLGYGSCSGDRMRRSESFSLSRRDFPKGFRSERDRGRREGNSNGSSWRRSSSWKEFADDEAPSQVRPPPPLPLLSHSSAIASVAGAAESVGRGTGRLASDSRSRSRSKDSSSGEPTRSIEVKEPTRSIEVRKPKEIVKERNISSDMEEGELEPDPRPAPQATTSQHLATNRVERIWETGNESKNRSEDDLESDVRTVSKEKFKSEEKLQLDSAVGTSILRDDNLPQNLPREVFATHIDEHQKPTEEEDGATTEVAKEITVTPVLATPLLTEGAATEQDPTEVTQQDRVSPNRERDSMREDSEDEEGHNLSCDSEFLSPLQLEIEGKQRAEPEVNLESGEVVKEKGSILENEGDAEPGVSQEEVSIDLVEPCAGHGEANENIELEAEPNTAGRSASVGNASVGSKPDEVTLGLMQSLSLDNNKGKGKSLAISPFTDANSAEEDDSMEGPSNRGFELVFLPKLSMSDKVISDKVVLGNNEDDKLKIEPLDLSLGLPGTSSDLPLQNLHPKPDSPHRTRGILSLPSSLPSKSDGFTASISYSGSQTFFHNPSCSLTQNSAENYEHSVGSHPIFKGIDQLPDRTVQEGQLSNEMIQKDEGVPLYPCILQNGILPKHPQNASHEHRYCKANGFQQKSSSSKFVLDSHEKTLEKSEEHKGHRRETNSNSLRSEQHTALSGFSVGNVKEVFAKLISDPFPVIGRRFQEMSEQSRSCFKEAIAEMVVNGDKYGELLELKEQLHRRYDLTPEELSKCHRVLLEILVAIKTGIPDSLGRTNSVPSSDLVEIFMGLRCKNLSCRSILPVDDCDCKVCKPKSGFCSACMCLVCFNFDNAADTCSWVGCDFCCHWCHTDCALRHSYIRNSRLTDGGNEMQFHCTACSGPSEMFGFVKEVFRTCAKNWKAETFVKELEFVRRIFSASEDPRGKRLHDVATQSLLKLENNSNLSGVFKFVMEFFAEKDMKSRDSPSTFSSKDVSSGSVIEKSNQVHDRIKATGVGKEPGAWFPSVYTEKAHVDTRSSDFPTLNSDLFGSQMENVKLRFAEKKHVDELDCLVKFKHEEAKMYQSRADEARKEAERLKHFATAQNKKIDEDYSCRIGKLRLLDSEEKCKEKSAELQILERAQNEYLNMKMKMESEIKNLFSKLEMVKRSLHS